ncbi:hypothetical protein D3C85_1302090 [compost metagenome]
MAFRQLIISESFHASIYDIFCCIAGHINRILGGRIRRSITQLKFSQITDAAPKMNRYSDVINTFVYPLIADSLSPHNFTFWRE